MAQFHDAPDRYLALMRDALPLYDTLQDELVRATAGIDAQRILDLGAGTGETSRRCLATHPRARVVAIDASADMLEITAGAVANRGTTRLARLEDELPEGPFDLIVSALAIHHLDGPGKADLFRRIHARLQPHGRFVMADVIVSDEDVEQPTPLDHAVDKPDRLDDLLDWLKQSRFAPTVTWAQQDLAVVAAAPTTNRPRRF